VSAWLLHALLAAGTWGSLDEAARVARAAELRERALPDRVVAVSEGFLGTRYQLSPLGEGEGPDADPRLSFDAVDCVTFVEEVMALSVSPDAEALLPTLDGIRYEGGRVAYEARKHVMEAQWLPQNEQAGFVRDVTRQYGGAATRTVKKVLDAKSWATKGGRGLKLPASAQAKGTFALDIIPAGAALEKLAAVPSGTVVVVVRADRPSLVTRVSHVGFVVQTKAGPALRHASRSYGKVVDEPFAHYLTRNLDFGAWTIEGLALFEVTVPPAP
jgi:hypothetical protein